MEEVQSSKGPNWTCMLFRPRSWTRQLPSGALRGPLPRGHPPWTWTRPWSCSGRGGPLLCGTTRRRGRGAGSVRLPCSQAGQALRGRRQSVRRRGSATLTPWTHPQAVPRDAVVLAHGRLPRRREVVPAAAASPCQRRGGDEIGEAKPRSATGATGHTTPTPARTSAGLASATRTPGRCSARRARRASRRGTCPSSRAPAWCPSPAMAVASSTP
mmetsp:Transcript_3833/g.12399  ORF Transcript_3833/g.12399 Transcript_3833/m.12399 type:complete len:214 (-) Transcript_3833:431-1072(-)